MTSRLPRSTATRYDARVIVLFDLDGTVLTFEGDAPGPGRVAMGRACRELCGEDLTSGVRFAGGTDRAIARTLLERAGRAIDEASIDAFLASYLRNLALVLESRRYRPIGDVASAVEACKARDACVGVATGNLRHGARLKLHSAGLGPVFAGARGGYGCDHELRDEVVRYAVRRCRGLAMDASVSGEDVVVVGDTAHDVSAARAIGAAVVGVAVNEPTRRELEEAGADAIVDSCGRELVDAIFTVSR